MTLKRIIKNIKDKLGYGAKTPNDVGADKYVFEPYNDELLALHIKEIQSKIFVRRNSPTDKEVLAYVFGNTNGRYHLPPPSIKLSNHCTILDLGSNIGLTIVHFKNVYPNSRVIGYEMDSSNYNIAKINCAEYSDVTLYNEAVWIHNETISYRSNINPDSFSINSSNNNSVESTTVKAVRLMDIIEKNAVENIDYLKMDIEGAEMNIFQEKDLTWMRHVNAMNIEVHHEDQMKLQEYIDILKDNGFEAWKDDRHWSAVIAKKG